MGSSPTAEHKKEATSNGVASFLRMTPKTVHKWGYELVKVHHTTSQKQPRSHVYLLDILEFVNPILFDSMQTPHPVLLHNNQALYRKHLFLHSKAVYQV